MSAVLKFKDPLAANAAAGRVASKISDATASHTVASHTAASHTAVTHTAVTNTVTVDEHKSRAEILIAEFRLASSELVKELANPTAVIRSNRLTSGPHRPTNKQVLRVGRRIKGPAGDGANIASFKESELTTERLKEARHAAIAKLQRYDLHHQLRIERFVTESSGYVSPIFNPVDEVIAAHTAFGVAKALLVILNFDRGTQYFLPENLPAEAMSQFFAARSAEFISCRLEAVDCNAASYADTSERDYERIPHQKVLRLWAAASEELVNFARGCESMSESIKLLAAKQLPNSSRAETLLNSIMQAVGVGTLSTRYLSSGLPNVSFEKLTNDERANAAVNLLLSCAAAVVIQTPQEILLSRYAELSSANLVNEAVTEAMPSNARNSAILLLRERTSAIAFMTFRGGRKAGSAPLRSTPKPEDFDTLVAMQLIEEILQLRREAKQPTNEVLQIEHKLVYAARIIAGAKVLSDHFDPLESAMSSIPPEVDSRAKATQILRYLAAGCGLPAFDHVRLTPSGVRAIISTIEHQVSDGACALFRRTPAGRLVTMSSETVLGLISAILANFK